MKSTTCKKCGNQIVWLKDFQGKWKAVDADRVEAGDVQYESARHGTHWENCKKKPAARPYVKPENFPVYQTPRSNFVRQIPEDEDARITGLLNGNKT